MSTAAGTSRLPMGKLILVRLVGAQTVPDVGVSPLFWTPMSPAALAACRATSSSMTVGRRRGLRSDARYGVDPRFESAAVTSDGKISSFPGGTGRLEAWEVWVAAVQAGGAAGGMGWIWASPWCKRGRRMAWGR